MAKSPNVIQVARLQIDSLQVTSLRGKRIVFLVNDYGFFLSHRLALGLALKQCGAEVIVLAPPHGVTARLRKLGILTVPVFLTRWGHNALAEAYSILEIARTYRRLKPDLVHHVTIKPVLYGSIAAQLAGVPAVINAVTGLGYVFLARGWGAMLRRMVVRILYRCAFRHRNLAVIFQNPEDRSLLSESGFLPRRASVLIRGSGVNGEQFSPSEHEPPLPVVVTMVARLLRDKGVLEFVEAATLLRSRGYTARFRLVGDAADGNPAAVAPQLVESWRRDGVVELIGFREDILPVYRESHLIVLPSYREGLPRTLIEGAACGLPLVASNVPGCREIVHHGANGLLVPVRDSSALAEALARLIDDAALRREFGRRSRQIFIEGGFQEETVTEQTLELYRSLLNGGLRQKERGLISRY